MTASVPGLLLDRDGVINHDPGYLYRAEDCRFIDGIFPLVRAFRARGFRVAVTTNQAGIGRGLYTEEDFHLLMIWMRQKFEEEHACLDAVYFCPFHPVHGQDHYRRESPFRKPNPGMLLQAIEDLALDPARSWTIGDKMSDLDAGRAAGVGTLVLHDSRNPQLEKREDYWVAPNLEAIAGLLQRAAL